jgi:hypothetical protein
MVRALSLVRPALATPMCAFVHNAFLDLANMEHASPRPRRFDDIVLSVDFSFIDRYDCVSDFVYGALLLCHRQPGTSLYVVAFSHAVSMPATCTGLSSSASSIAPSTTAPYTRHLDNGSVPLHSATSTLSAQSAIIFMGYSSSSIRTDVPIGGGGITPLFSSLSVRVANATTTEGC